ncbi:condensation domain-containing protein [Gordonia amicalis]|nr:condensation domain-containing protein [Gordonia amicalis]
MDDVSIGTAVAGRDDPAVADLVGMFVNTVVLRTALRPGDTVRDLVTGAHRRCARAMSHADVPFERVVDALAPQRSPSHSPLFQVALSVQPDQLTDLSHWTGSAELLDARVPSAKYDVTVSVTERSDDYVVEFAYATDRLRREHGPRLGVPAAAGAQPDGVGARSCPRRDRSARTRRAARARRTTPRRPSGDDPRGAHRPGVRHRRPRRGRPHW